MDRFQSSLNNKTKEIFQRMRASSRPQNQMNFSAEEAWQTFHGITTEIIAASKEKPSFLAIPFQKILVVPQGTLKNNQTLEITGDGTYITSRSSSPSRRLLTQNAYVKRVNEYPNHFKEFNSDTDTVLIAWEQTNTSPHFIENIIQIKTDNKSIDIISQSLFRNNFIISPTPPNSEPDPPIDDALSQSILGFPMAKTDFTEENYALLETVGSRNENTIKVIVSDTGLKINLNTDNNQYPNSQDVPVRFPIAAPSSSNISHTIGFCSLTNYLDNKYLSSHDSSPMRMLRIASFPEPNNSIDPSHKIPLDDSSVLKNPHDDHPQRHGTFVSAIISQNTNANAQIIPLKLFDFLGLGTLFDILCGFNYIFARIATGENIRVVNASWGGTPSSREDYQFLENKIRVLKDLNVFIITSAGNRKKATDLDENPVDVRNEPSRYDIAQHKVYPACYSADYENVITVTTVAENWEEKIDIIKTTSSRYINQEIERHLLGEQEMLSTFLKMQRSIAANGYRPFEKFSSQDSEKKQYVQVGIVAHPLGGIFPTPFGGERKLPIIGSSFATAFMSAYVVNFLRATSVTDVITLRNLILDSLHNDSSLMNYIEKGRYLELSSINGLSIADNFKSVLNFIR